MRRRGGEGGEGDKEEREDKEEWRRGAAGRDADAAPTSRLRDVR